MQPNSLDSLMAQSGGEILKRIIKENVLGSTKMIVFPRNHHFYESFNKNIERLVTAGIINYFGDDYKDLISVKRFSHLKLSKVKPMNLKHLEAGFVVWLMSLIVPVAAFIVEWIIRFKDFIVFRSVFTAFTKLKEENVRNRDRNIQTFMKKLKLAKEKVQTIFELKKVEIYQESFEQIQIKETQIDQKIQTVQKDTIEPIYDEIIMNDF